MWHFGSLFQCSFTTRRLLKSYASVLCVTKCYLILLIVILGKIFFLHLFLFEFVYFFVRRFFRTAWEIFCNVSICDVFWKLLFRPHYSFCHSLSGVKFSLYPQRHVINLKFHFTLQCSTDYWQSMFHHWILKFSFLGYQKFRDSKLSTVDTWI